jgi:recombinational DNA repair ATPase RecF
MKLVAIDVEGFRAFARRQQFDLDASGIVLFGTNGQGKTSLFDAILWGLSGSVPRLGEDANRIVSMYSESGEARVTSCCTGRAGGSTPARAIVPDFGRRIGRLAALSGERNGERRGRYRLLCLAYDLFGDSLFEASCRLGGKSTGRCL